MSTKGSAEPRQSHGGSERASAAHLAATHLAADVPSAIRNVALVGHSGAGKTTLVEALLAATGTITRMGTIAEGTTVADAEPAEVHQQRSVALAVVPIESDGVKINLLDTPGYADFTGELRAGLRAADAALFVVSAVDAAAGIDAATTALWTECEQATMPRAVLISQLDHPRADYDAVLDACQRAFGPSVLPMYLPVHGDGAVTGLRPLLSAGGQDNAGQDAVGQDAAGQGAGGQDAAGQDDVGVARSALIEGIIAESEDETLMDRYLGGEDIGTDTLLADLETAVARGSFFPVLAASAVAGLGITELLAVLCRAFPPPTERRPPSAVDAGSGRRLTLTCDPDGPLAAEVVRTSSDAFLGRVSVVRVFSGTLHEDAVVHVAGRGSAERGHPEHDGDERLTHLYAPFGTKLRAVPHCIAGDICALAKLADAETADTVSDKERPLSIEAWATPEPLLPVAVEAATHGDEDALVRSLAKVAAADPALRIERNDETHQIILWCLGEAHADVVLERLADQGVGLRTLEVITPLRETFDARASGLGRHVKQSGGHGQYGICEIEVEPLPRGGGFEFVDRIVGGAIPKAYVASVEKGIRTQMDRGVAEGFPVVDIRATLVGGKTHGVDSSDAAFQAAGALALRDAAEKGRIRLLEPVVAVTISVPDGYVGAVMSDLSARRGHPTGTTSLDGERTEIGAEVPERELLRYVVDLRSLTGGTGRFTRRYLRHQLVP